MIRSLEEIIDSIISTNGISLSSDVKEQYLNPTYESISLTFREFENIWEACLLVNRAIHNKSKIYIYGDFDVDGITATSIMVRALRFMGIENSNLGYYIPDRVTENHGLNRKALTRLSKQGVKLLITVDCGINQQEEVDYARYLGMEVIVTDHHSPGESMVRCESTTPNVLTLTPPKSLETEYSGAGIAFKFAQGLCDLHTDGKENWAKSLLWLACLGTLVDCVPQYNENRAICVLGLKQLNEKTPACIRALALMSEMQRPIDKRDITWNISPRLSSPSRMRSKLAEEILMMPETETRKIRELSLEMEHVNDQRKKIVKEQLKALQDQLIVNDEYIIGVIDKGNYDSRGIQGLMASQLCGEYNKTTFVFTDVGGGVLYGSVRGSDNCDISEVIRRAHLEKLLVEGGGHIAAGGIIIYVEKLNRLMELVTEVVRDEKITGETKVVPIPLNTKEVTLKTYRALSVLEPYSDGDSPIFTTKFDCVAVPELMGKTKEHLSFTVSCQESNTKYRVVGWGMAHRLKEFERLVIKGRNYSENEIELVYRMMINNWRSKTSLELEAIDFKVMPKHPF